MPIKVDSGVDALHKHVLTPWAVKILFQSRMPRLLQWRTPSARCFLLLTMLESKVHVFPIADYTFRIQTEGFRWCWSGCHYPRSAFIKHPVVYPIRERFGSVQVHRLYKWTVSNTADLRNQPVKTPSSRQPQTILRGLWHCFSPINCKELRPSFKKNWHHHHHNHHHYYYYYYYFFFFFRRYNLNLWTLFPSQHIISTYCDPGCG